MLEELNYREREILRLRYGLADGYAYTLEEVGQIFSVTRERVRQIEAKAVRKLQHPMRSQGTDRLCRRSRRKCLRVFTTETLRHGEDKWLMQNR